MKLTFLGTKANIESRAPLHARHSSLKVAYKRSSVIIDCGLDWLDLVGRWRAAAIVLTHAHPDHAFGLQNGAPCPVLATAETWEAIGHFPIEQRQTVLPRKPMRVGDLDLEAFPVSHSLRAPAVGFRVAAGRRAFFYVPDVVDIEDRTGALAGIDLYVGDGSTLTRPLVRRQGGSLFGHTTIRAQLGWCAKAGVRRALFTHCGSDIVGDERRAEAKLAELAAERGLSASFARDGQELLLS